MSRNWGSFETEARERPRALSPDFGSEGWRTRFEAMHSQGHFRDLVCILLDYIDSLEQELVLPGSSESVEKVALSATQLRGILEGLRQSLEIIGKPEKYA